MKKILILLVILFLNNILQAQTVYQCTKTSVAIYNTDRNQWDTRVIEEDSNIKILLMHNIITINAKTKSVLSTGKITSVKETDDYSSTTWNAYDYESMESCQVCLIKYINSNKMDLIVFKSLKSIQLALTYEIN